MNLPPKKAIYQDLLLIVLIYGLAGVVYFSLFEFLRVNQFDTLSFIKGAQYLFGVDGGAVLQQRITKPIPLLLPGLAERLGLSATPVMLFQNALLFLLSGILIYRWSLDVYGDRKTGMAAALILLGCQCFALYPLFYLSDIWGYTFIILIGWLDYRLSGRQSTTPWLWLGLLTACGLLSKESTVIAFLYVGLLVLFTPNSGKRKFQIGLTYTLATLLPFFLVQFILTTTLDINVAERVADTHRYHIQYAFGLDYLKQLYRVLDVHWIWVVIGLWAIWKHERNQGPWFRAILVLTVVFLAVAPIFKFYLVDRILFMVAPFLILLASKAHILFPRTFFPLIVIGGAANVAVAYFIYQADTGSLLAIAGMGYLLLVAIAWLIERKKPILTNS